MNSQSARCALTREIVDRCKIASAVETGAFFGTTTEFFAGLGLRVATAEINRANAAHCRARFKGLSNVKLYQSSSTEMIKRLIKAGKNLAEPILFYLDAHWEQHLPLAEELQLVLPHFPNAVVMIDDFSVPDDPGYGFDDYGPGKRIDLDYLTAANVKDVSLYFPSTPSWREDGARRGCCVITAAPEMAAILNGLSLLRRCI